MSRRTIRVACGQMRATFLNEAEHALRAVRDLVEQAGRSGVDLLVLPECAYPAYLLGSVDSYRQSGCLSGEAYLAVLGEAAQQHRMHIVSGFIHEVQDKLFNGAALISPDRRVLGVYHKQLLWHADARWFEPDEKVAAFDCALGRIGMLICADARIPEVVATLVADGAELIALPTCWINSADRPGEYYNPQSDFLIRARSREFGVPFVCANKFGKETGNVRYNGQSLITGADGSVRVQADGEFQGLVTADLRLGAAYGIRVAPRWRTIMESAAAVPREGSPDVVDVAVASSTATARILQNISPGPGGSGPALMKSLLDSGVTLLVARAESEHQAEQLARWGARRRIDVAAFPQQTDVQRRGGIDLGVVSGQAARGFAACRGLALRGAQLIGVLDDNVDPILLRARALENRVFVAVAGRSSVALYGVNGEPLEAAPIPTESRSEPGEGVSRFWIRPAAANDKLAAPGTDVFAQRRTACYRW